MESCALPVPPTGDAVPPPDVAAASGYAPAAPCDDPRWVAATHEMAMRHVPRPDRPG